ncbi:MAG: serine/threonine protein kinase [Planctomycetes bacterium]|nr:serine/threonine protein kinase [Planctomycetota bacterium]
MSDQSVTDVPHDEIPPVREPVEHGPITAQRDRVGPYQILQVLGEGGMGVVYLAEQKEPVRRRVALKLIKLGMDTKEVIARFESERQALAMMSHPHVAAVLDAGATEHGRPYFVMDYVPGIPITDYCDRHRLAVRERLELFVHVCEAVQHAHQKGIIHRDIKPSNVLVMLQDGRPLAKVIDFGVAKATAGRLTERTVFTEQGRIIGTPAYMSPEQAEMTTLDIDTRTDVYSLGVLLYELLVGALPFDPKTLQRAGYAEIQRIIREVEPPKPSTRVSTPTSDSAQVAEKRHVEPRALERQLRGDLDWITMRALEKDRTRRYATPLELAADIQRHLDHEPVLACPPSVRYRLGKFVRKHRGPVASAAAVLVALTVGLVTTTILYFEAEAAKKAAERDRLAALEAQHEADARRADADAARLAEAAQRKLAEDGKAEAEQQRKQADAVANYLVEAFRSPDPTQDGREIKVADLLNRAADRLDQEFSDDLLTRSRLLNAVGETYYGLGLFDKAVALLERACALRRDQLGDDHEDTLTSMNNLTVVYLSAGQFGKALPLIEQTLERRRTKLGENHPETLRSMGTLAEAYYLAGQSPKALSLFKQILERRQIMLGEDHADTFTSMNNLAVAYESAGQLAKALPLYEQTLERRRAKLGEDHPDTLTSMNNLAVAYRYAGQLEKALPLYEQTLERARAKLGEDHPDTLTSMNNLAVAYESAGQFEKSLPLKKQTLERIRAKLGEDHPDTLTSMNNLAVAYRSVGELAKALPLCEQTLERRRATLGENHPDTLSSMYNLGKTYWYAKQPERAEVILREALEIERQKRPDEWWTSETQVLLGVVLAEQDRFEDAEALLVGGYEGLNARLETIPPSERHRLRLALTQLVKLYDAWEKPDEAAQWLAKLLESYRETIAALPADSPERTGRLAEFGLKLLESKRYAAAEPLLRECLVIRQKAHPDTWQLANTQSMLGGALAGQARELLATDPAAAAAKFAEAESLLLAGYDGLKSRVETIPTPERTTRLTEALHRLIDLYTAWDKPDQAAEWRKKLQETKKPEEAKEPEDTRPAT